MIHQGLLENAAKLIVFYCNSKYFPVIIKIYNLDIYIIMSVFLLASSKKISNFGHPFCILV